MEKIEKIIGDRVRRLRKDAGLSQTDLAKKANTSLTTINRLEGAKQLPRVETITDIATALGVTEVDLMGGPADTPGDIVKQITQIVESAGLNLNKDESDLINIFRGLRPDQRQLFLDFGRGLLGANNSQALTKAKRR